MIVELANDVSDRIIERVEAVSNDTKLVNFELKPRLACHLSSTIKYFAPESRVQASYIIGGSAFGTCLTNFFVQSVGTPIDALPWVAPQNVNTDCHRA